MTTMQERFSSSVATGAQNVTLSLTKGTYRKVKTVYCYIPGADDSAYVEVHRTDGTPAAADLKGDTSYQAFTAIDTPDDTWATTALKLAMDTGLATTVVCKFAVVYDYY